MEFFLLFSDVDSYPTDFLLASGVDYSTTVLADDCIYGDSRV